MSSLMYGVSYDDISSLIQSFNQAVFDQGIFFFHIAFT